MIGVKFHNGQGLGNQLFCYVTTRSLAYDHGMNHHIFNTKNFGAPRWNSEGLYFMDIPLKESDINESEFTFYQEKEKRVFLNNNRHDKKIGCDIRGFDSNLFNVNPFTLIDGVLQSEKYFIHNKELIKNWLKVKDEFESSEFYSNNLCVINFRGGEYVGQKELYLNPNYYKNAISEMKKINSSMDFIVITDDVFAAQKYFKDFPCYHFDIAKDYVSIKNAKYLILSNSSFPYFAVLTNEVLEFIIAPKYWARHNVSDGYWATNQNIYTGWNYIDRKGKIFTADECKKENDYYK
jgi:hypothetical protein